MYRRAVCWRGFGFGLQLGRTWRSVACGLVEKLHLFTRKDNPATHPPLVTNRDLSHEYMKMMQSAKPLRRSHLDASNQPGCAPTQLFTFTSIVNIVVNNFAARAAPVQFWRWRRLHISPWAMNGPYSDSVHSLHAVVRSIDTSHQGVGVQVELTQPTKNPVLSSWLAWNATESTRLASKQPSMLWFRLLLRRPPQTIFEVREYWCILVP